MCIRDRYQADYEQAGFRWLDHNDADNSIFAWLRADKLGAHPLVVALSLIHISRPPKSCPSRN